MRASELDTPAECASHSPLYRRPFLTGLAGLWGLGATALYPRRAVGSDVRLTADVRQPGTRLARYDIAAAETELYAYRPLLVRYNAVRDRTTVTLAADGALVSGAVFDDERGVDAGAVSVFER